MPRGWIMLHRTITADLLLDICHAKDDMNELEEQSTLNASWALSLMRRSQSGTFHGILRFVMLTKAVKVVNPDSITMTHINRKITDYGR
jgi:hypothetical protein